MAEQQANQRTSRAYQRNIVTRAEVLQAVAMSITEDGFAKADLRVVAKRLGVSPATVYYHIGSKEQALFECLMERHGAWLGRTREIVQSPLPADLRLRAYLRERARLADANHRLSTALLSEIRYLEPAHYTACLALRDEVDRLLLGLLEEGISTGELKPLANPKIALFGILDMLTRLHVWFREDGPLTRDEIAEIWWDVIFKGIGPAPERREGAPPA